VSRCRWPLAIDPSPSTVGVIAHGHCENVVVDRLVSGVFDHLDVDLGDDSAMFCRTAPERNMV
jgi:hypothetical protein